MLLWYIVYLTPTATCHLASCNQHSAAWCSCLFMTFLQCLSAVYLANIHPCVYQPEMFTDFCCTISGDGCYFTTGHGHCCHQCSNTFCLEITLLYVTVISSLPVIFLYNHCLSFLYSLVIKWKRSKFMCTHIKTVVASVHCK